MVVTIKFLMLVP